MGLTGQLQQGDASTVRQGPGGVGVMAVVTQQNS